MLASQVVFSQHVVVFIIFETMYFVEILINKFKLSLIWNLDSLLAQQYTFWINVARSRCTPLGNIDPRVNIRIMLTS